MTSINGPFPGALHMKMLTPASDPMGLILPALTGIRPGLTTWAAGGRATIMVLAIGVGLLRGEFLGAALPLVLFGLSSFVVYRRTRESA